MKKKKGGGLETARGGGSYTVRSRMISSCSVARAAPAEALLASSCNNISKYK